MPNELRLLILLFLGSLLGAFVNFAVYRFGWFSRPISPWIKPPQNLPPRTLLDRIPIFGWLSLRRHVETFGKGFWIRPLCVELAAAFALPMLYRFEVLQLGLLPQGAALAFPAADLSLMLHAQFATHATLCILMLAASLIDIDEMIIPDAITRPGTLLGLSFATILPLSLLPYINLSPAGNLLLETLHATSPNPFPAWLANSPSKLSLAIALFSLLAWSLAIVPRTWYTRHGFKRALQLSAARTLREPDSYLVALLALLASLAIILVWATSEPRWQALLSSLIGMAAGGAMIWTVRLIGYLTLRREAMGFGDVTLMSMIGAFLGWQPCVIIFFLAPFAALAIALIRLPFRPQREMPYGPYLCLATLTVILYWNPLWASARDIFSLGILIPIMLLGSALLMALMLGLWQLLLHFIPHNTN